MYYSFDAFLFTADLVLILIITAIQGYRYREKNNQLGSEVGQLVFGSKGSFTTYNSLLVLAWTLSSFTLILIFIKPIDQFIQDKNWLGLLLNLFLFLLIIYNNSLLATVYLFKKNISLSVTFTIGIGAASLVGYIGLPSNQINFISVPFQTFHLGDIKNSVFIVKKETCQVLNTLNADSCIESEGLGCIYPDVVANRIGKEYLLVFEKIDKSDSKPNLIKIPLKKEDVLGWSLNKLPISKDCKVKPAAPTEIKSDESKKTTVLIKSAIAPHTSSKEACQISPQNNQLLCECSGMETCSLGIAKKQIDLEHP